MHSNLTTLRNWEKWIFYPLFLVFLCSPTLLWATEFPHLATSEQRKLEKQALRQEYAQLTAEQNTLKKAYLLATTEAERNIITGQINSLNLRIQLYESRLQTLQVAEKSAASSAAPIPAPK